ncbi:MAG: ribonuclease H-like domain-containing protein [Nitrospiraceae bacterium]
MIESTFLFLPGIAAVRERQLWSSGISTWQTFLEARRIPRISETWKMHYDEVVKAARDQYANENPDWFAPRLKPREHWRLYEWLRPRAVFLDIETAGPFGEITVVGLFGQGRMTQLVRGETLTEECLSEHLSQYSLLVTFNGAGFDLPCLRAQFPRLRLNHAHLDLRFAGRALGWKGGLKQVERRVGIERPAGIDGLDGWDAVRLWNQWRHGHDPAALDRLLAYNAADCINLEPMADLLYCGLREQCGLDDFYKPISSAPFHTAPGRL